MVVRSIFLLVAFFSSPVWALSLGDMKVISYFAQPLQAEIEIPVFSEQELNSLQIQLAPREKYDAEGVEYIPLLSQLHFALRARSNSAPYIAVTTTLPVAELLFSVIIQVDWDGGSFVKNYDVLLTPPTVSDAENLGIIDTTQPLAPPPTVAHIETPRPEIVPEKVTPRPAPVAAKLHGEITKLDSGDYVYGPVGRGDTLSTIAEKFSQLTSLSFEKRKAILYKLNPQAFAGGAKHRLQAGYKLVFREIEVDTASEPSTNINDPNDVAEAEKIRKEINDKRELVKQYRLTNDELRQKLKTLEQEVAAKANALSLPTKPTPTP